MRACCPAEHAAGECWGCPFEEPADLWATVNLIRSCTTKVSAKDEPERWGLSLEGATFVFDHPALFRIEDPDAAYEDVQRGIAWMNGEE